MSRRIRWIAPFAVVLLAGCNAANLQVQDQTPGAVAPGPAATGAPQTGGTGATPGSVVSGQGGESSKVFFERVLTQGEELDQVTEIGFASESSETTTPVGIALKNPVDFSPALTLAPSPGQVDYLQSNGLMSSSLVSTQLGTLSTQSLYDFPSEAVAVSESRQARKVAWIDIDGNAFVSDLSSGQAQAIAVPAGEIARIQLSLAGNRLLVRTASDEAMTFVPSATGWTQEMDLQNVIAAALSADGTKLADVTSSGQVEVNGTAIAQLKGDSVHDLSWRHSDALSYWVRNPSGLSEIRLLPAQKGAKEQSVALLNMPASVTDGVACPAWDGDTVYFANFTGGEYRIERVKVQSAVAVHGTAFAVPPASDEGLICPALAQARVKK